MPDPNRSALSIVIPVHSGRTTLERCLESVAPQLAHADEIIVVDDGSSEDMSSVAAAHGATLVRLDRQSGAAAARNRGAAMAVRSWLLFLDSDVALHPDGLARVRVWTNDGTVDGVIGSYDDAPDASGMVSRFKNLAHHYFHQQAPGPIASFWGACGAVRRDLFSRVGGFDERRFARPSIEDVELGWRMADQHARIVLDPALQVTHLKRWTLQSLIVTDVMDRAMPWTRWALARGRITSDLNTSGTQRVAAVLALLLVATGLSSIAISSLHLPFLAMIVAAVVLNRGLFHLFWRRGGATLFLAGFFLQQLYYLCALTGLALGIVQYARTGRGASAPPAGARV